MSPETWSLLDDLRSGAFGAAFDQAFCNGAAFLVARDGLRGRRPVVVEWKGSHRAPGDEVAPIDLRIDHVYLVSCKYMSNITINASPVNLFERLLGGGHGIRGSDWYGVVAPDEHQHLYRAVRSALGRHDLPPLPGELGRADRLWLAGALHAGWPAETEARYQALVDAVAKGSAERWRAQLASRNASEAMLWRMLRIGSAPYFLLGSSASGPLRLRVATPWDWRARFRLAGFTCRPLPGGQPKIAWEANVVDRQRGGEQAVRGHVEIRWSHGRFGGNPEAKVYLDMPHSDIPGYFPIG